MLRLVACKNPNVIVEVKVYHNSEFLGYASMLEFGFIGGSEQVFDKLNEVQLKTIEDRLCRMWVNKAGY